MNENDLIECLIRGDHVTAITICEEIEINDTDSFESNVDRCIRFYSIFLACHLICGDLTGSRYLWRRAPEIIKHNNNKSPTDFCLLWEIAKNLWGCQLKEANELLSTWNSSDATLNQLSRDIRKSLRESQFQMISQCYNSISFQELADRVSMADEELMDELRNRSWAVNADNFVTPTPFKMNNNTTLPTKTAEEMMTRVSEYVALFERKPLKLDLTVHVSKEGEKSVNATSKK